MIATHVSRPIRSASASGPIGCAKPSRAIVSIASASATPSISAYAASLMNGMRMRFETKPGKSRASAGSLPRSRASCDDRRGRLVGRLHGADHLDELQHRHRVEEVHADHVLGPLRHRGERRDRDRRRVRREDRVVRAARRPRGGRRPPSSRASSTTASINRSASTRSSTGVTRASTSSAGAPPFSASRSRLLRIAARPRSIAPGNGSCSDTRRPDAATTCAIPPPICPAPTTRTCSNSTRGGYNAAAPPRSAAPRLDATRGERATRRSLRPRAASATAKPPPSVACVSRQFEVSSSATSGRSSGAPRASAAVGEHELALVSGA